jgi:hypothetical protein
VEKLTLLSLERNIEVITGGILYECYGLDAFASRYCLVVAIFFISMANNGVAKKSRSFMRSIFRKILHSLIIK